MKWEIKPLGEVCEFQRGLTYEKSDEVESSSNVVLRATNIDLATNLLSFDELRYISDAVKVPQSKKVKKGSLMVCTASGSKSHLGKIAYIDDDYGYAFGGFMGMITPENGLAPRFLFHLMTSGVYKDFIEALSDGANINNLKFNDLKRFPVPVPPLAEQRRIVGILDEAFAGIATAKANAEKNLRNARALFDSRLQGLFDLAEDQKWELKKLADIGSVFGRGKSRHRPRNEPKLYGGKYPFIQTGDVRNAERVVESYSQTYSEMGLAQSKLWPKGTICITIAANIAETAILGFDACIPDSIIGLVVDEKKTDNVFVLYLLRSFKEHLQAHGKGSAQHNINMGTFEEQLFPIPALAVQRVIVTALDELGEGVHRLASLYLQKVAALDALKKSLLHQAFTGQLATAGKGAALDLVDA